MFGGSCMFGLVMEENYAAAKTVLLQEFQIQTNIVGESRFAASYDDRHNEHVTLVDQPRPEGVSGKLRTAS